MKFILPVVCSVLFVGCGDPVQTSTPATEPQIVESTTANAPILPEAAAPITPVSKPEVKVTTETAVPAPVTAAAVDGNAMFVQKCASCHGNKAEKSALNKSQVIADFNEQQLKDSLHGYQTGTYGKEMKSLMQGQVKSLSPEQINALAKYISTL